MFDVIISEDETIIIIVIVNIKEGPWKVTGASAMLICQ